MKKDKLPVILRPMMTICLTCMCRILSVYFFNTEKEIYIYMYIYTFVIKKLTFDIQKRNEWQ